jgi:hypothetical protein
MTKTFETLRAAEQHLTALGFRLVPGSCDWRNEAGDDAGCYAIEAHDIVRGFRVEISDGRNVIRLADSARGNGGGAGDARA